MLHSVAYWADLLASLAIGEEGLPEMRMVISDATDRKRQEESTIAASERLQLAVQASNVGLWDWDLVSNTMTYSKELKSQIGFQEHEISDDFSEWKQRLHPDDLQPIMARIQAFIETPASSFECEFRFRHKNGSYRRILTQAALKIDDQGRPTRMLGSHVDVTERWQLEEAMRLRDRAIQSASEGIVITDPNQPDNPIIYVNAGFESMTGYSAKDVVGRNCRLLSGMGTDAFSTERIRVALQDECDCSVEILNYRKDGTTFWNEVRITPVFDERGKLANFIGIQLDVTQRRLLEEQLRQSQKMESVGQLAGGIAHDFNNMLTVIQGYNELLLAKSYPVEQSRKFLCEIQSATERAADLTRQLLAFSHRQLLEPKSLNLNDVVNETHRLLSRLLSETICLELFLDPQLNQISGDRSQLVQVLMNLVINSRDALSNGGRIEIRTQNVMRHLPARDSSLLFPPKEFVLLSVTDNGVGMSDEVKARVFEPFFTTKPIGKGTGLGLAIVYGIVTRSDGFIEIESHLGKGTRIDVYLPQSGSMAEEMHAKPKQPRTQHGHETILLVEDDASVREMVRTVLTNEGYHVLEAENGSQALRLTAKSQRPFQLLVTDVVMPEMGGRDLALQLSQLKPSIRVLFMTGYVDDPTTRFVLSQDKANVLLKPFSPTDLLLKVRNVLQE